jgi:hypothetical protein
MRLRTPQLRWLKGACKAVDGWDLIGLTGAAAITAGLAAW